ncbi:MAG: ArsR family transcriptional regulator [Hadesarchaea archaeon]|nr:ArsR family transcriptional regulator [Hadesarchaea archaeon]
MARKGRPVESLKVKDHNSTFTSESDQLIIHALGQTPMTFTGIQERTKLSSSTLAEHLKKLEKKNYIDRSGDPRVIKLSFMALKPTHNVVRNLATVSPLARLDIEKGATILTEEVVDPCIEISTFSINTTKKPKTPECSHSTSVECYKEHAEIIKWLHSRPSSGEKRDWWFPLSPEEKKRLPSLLTPKFNAYHLLKALARYSFERYMVKTLQTYGRQLYGKTISRQDFKRIAEQVRWSGRYGKIRWHGRDIQCKKIREHGRYVKIMSGLLFVWVSELPHDEKLLESLKKQSDNPEVFPALGVARKCAVVEKFDALLEWIDPLLARVELGTAGGIQHAESASNLAAVTFRSEGTLYFEQVLSPIWKKLGIWKNVPSRSRKEREKEGKRRR